MDYLDKLVQVNDVSLVLFNYYFPSLTQKKIELNEIEKASKIVPNSLNGKYRIWGSGNFVFWFPKDTLRYKRKFIYRLKLSYQYVRVCFTVENEEEFERIMKEKGITFQG